MRFVVSAIALWVVAMGLPGVTATLMGALGGTKGTGTKGTETKGTGTFVGRCGESWRRGLAHDPPQCGIILQSAGVRVILLREEKRIAGPHTQFLYYCPH